MSRVLLALLLLPRLTLEDLRAPEGTFPGGFTVQTMRATIAPPLEEEGEFQLRVVPGTANAEDIGWSGAETRRVVIPAGKREFEIRFFVPADGIPEGDQALQLIAETTKTPLEFTRERITMTLLDDDDRPALAPEKATVVAGETLSMRLVLPEAVSVATTYAITTTPELEAPAGVTIEAGQRSGAFSVRALSPAAQAWVRVRHDGSDVAGADLGVVDFVLHLEEPLRVRAGGTLVAAARTDPELSLGIPLEALSSDPAVFTVQRETGSKGAILITAVAPGTATLTVRTRGGAISTTAPVVVTAE